jgi:hypothetical protein
MLVLESIEVTIAQLDSLQLWGRSIDIAVPGSPGDAYSLDLAGWVLGRSSPAVAVELIYEDTVVQRIPLEFDRPDVAAVYPGVPGGDRSGFQTSLSVPGTTPELELSVQAVLRDGGRAPLGVIHARRSWRDLHHDHWGSKEKLSGPDGMQVYGISVVRNEADLIRINALHHLSVGFDRLLIIDNGSSDGTDEILRELARDERVQWTSVAGAFRHSEMTTTLAHEAFFEGADWVIPIDADEFWHAPGGDLRGVLTTTSAGALQVQVVNFIQRREQTQRSSDALLSMTRRTPQPIGPLKRIAELVEARQIAFVEHLYAPKWISRASPALQISEGNHTVSGVRGPLDGTTEIVCLHAPLRARSVLEGKADDGRPIEELPEFLKLRWHVRRWRELAEQGELEREWIANSYVDDYLDVYGAHHRVVFDPTLRNIVLPWITRPDLQAEREAR